MMLWLDGTTRKGVKRTGTPPLAKHMKRPSGT